MLNFEVWTHPNPPKMSNFEPTNWVRRFDPTLNSTYTYHNTYSFITYDVLIWKYFREWFPYISELKESNNQDYSVQIKGLYWDIWNDISQQLNFSTNVTKLKIPSGKWSAMVNQLKNKTFDLILTGNSQTPERSTFTDFSFAITLSSLRLIYRRNSHESTNWVLYSKSFLPQAWMGLLTSFVSLIVLLGSIFLLSNHVSCSFKKTCICSYAGTPIL